MTAEHVHARDCASRDVDDLFRGPCDCDADELCGDGDCDLCYPLFDDEDAFPGNDLAPVVGDRAPKEG